MEEADDPSSIDSLVFGGGGARGFAYIGALRALETHGITVARKKIKHVGGASVGAAVAFLVSLGYTSDELERAMERTDISKIASLNVADFVSTYGLSNVEALRRILGELVSEKLGPMTEKKLTFEEHFRRTGVRLVVTVTDLAKAACVYCSHEETPDWDVADTVVHSMRVPIVFEPGVPPTVSSSKKLRRGTLLVDGGMTDNCPLSKFNLKTTIAFRIMWAFGGGATPISMGLLDYLSRIAYTVLTAAEEYQHKFMDETVKKSVVEIDAGDLSATSFNLSDMDKQRLIERGFETTCSYLAHRVLHLVTATVVFTAFAAAASVTED